MYFLAARVENDKRPGDLVPPSPIVFDNGPSEFNIRRVEALSSLLSNIILAKTNRLISGYPLPVITLGSIVKNGGIARVSRTTGPSDIKSVSLGPALRIGNPNDCRAAVTGIANYLLRAPAIDTAKLKICRV